MLIFINIPRFLYKDNNLLAWMLSILSVQMLRMTKPACDQSHLSQLRKPLLNGMLRWSADPFDIKA